jgi:hypothetical protein
MKYPRDNVQRFCRERVQPHSPQPDLQAATNDRAQSDPSPPIETNQLRQFLESFLVARWGRPVMERARAPRVARPWGGGPAPANLQDLTWAVFADGGQPIAVGLRPTEPCGGQTFLIVYWRHTNLIETHRWRIDSIGGWLHVREL